MITIQQLLAAATERLAGITDSPHLEAELLCAHVLQTTRIQLRAHPEQRVSAATQALFDDYLKRRCQREPLAYLIGYREFWSLSLAVTRDTLIPRPETELLVEQTLNLYPDKTACIKVADLGTGSGAIALALASERPLWQIDATDISKNALAIARDNAQRLGLHQVSFWQGNWCDGLPDLASTDAYDVILSNPPYLSDTEWHLYADGLAFEPKDALLAGEDGLAAIHVIADAARYRLKPNGHLLIEHGFSQADAVQQVFAALGYVDVVTHTDLAGQDRVTMGRYCSC